MFATERPGLPSFFACLVGVFFLVQGVWGLSSREVFGFLSTNTLQTIIHLCVGVVVLYFGLRKTPSLTLATVGFALFVLGVGWFLPMTRDAVVQALAVNRVTAAFDILLGVLCWTVGTAKPKKFY